MHTPPAGPAEDADRVDLPSTADSPAAAARTRQLKAGQLVPLTDIEHLRLVLHANGDSDLEIDPIAFLLTDQGTVRSDNDMVFYGQPDHTTGAVSLAADDTGATTALHLTPRALPSAITEILLTAQLSAGRSGSSSQLHVLDLDTGTALGHVDLPTAGATGLLQLGALQRTASGWALQPQPAQLDLDLASLATAAGIRVE